MFLKVCFPGGLGTHEARYPVSRCRKEMTHDLEMNFNKIAPFGKEDTAKELQDHAAKTQDTLVDAVENAEVAEIKRAVFRALTRLRAATIKEFDTIARLETQAIDAYNDAHHYRAENPLAHLHEDEARKGTNGVGINGVTANFMFFDRRTFWVLPSTYFYLPKGARAYLFPQSIEINYLFCSGPVSVDPICPQPTVGFVWGWKPCFIILRFCAFAGWQTVRGDHAQESL